MQGKISRSDTICHVVSILPFSHNRIFAYNPESYLKKIMFAQ